MKLFVFTISNCNRGSKDSLFADMKIHINLRQILQRVISQTNFPKYLLLVFALVYFANIGFGQTCTSPTATISTVNTSCGLNNGIITVNPTGGSSSGTIINSDLTSTPSNLTLAGNASISSGELILTPNLGNKNGSAIITNSSAITGNILHAEWDLYIGGGSQADGFSFSFGDDAVAGGGEAGSGSKLRIGFDTYQNNGSNPTGVYIWYNGSVVTSTTTFTFRSASYQRVILDINNSGQLTLSVGSTTYFTNYSLPVAYTTTDKSNWKCVFSARTGGSYDMHKIDNLNITLQNTSYFEYSNNGGSNYQTSNVFPNLAVGTYPMSIRMKGANSCASSLGNVTVSNGGAPGNQSTYGSDSWIGYAYTWTGTPGFANYIGYVTEPSTFNRSIGQGNISGATTNLCSTPSNNFAIKYKMRKTFPAGYYTFTIGGDDGIRLSIDGGVSYLIDGWSSHGYTTYSNSSAVYLNGTYDLVLDYYEEGGGAQSSFSYTSIAQMTVPSSGNNSFTTCSGNLYDAGGSAGSYDDYWDGYTVIYPGTVGNQVQVAGNITCEGGYDYLSIYDGVGTSGTLLWGGSAHGSGTSCATFTVPLIQSVTGPLTVSFHSDFSNNCAGFNLAVSCCSPPSVVTVSGGGANCGSATLTASGGTGGTMYWQGTTSNGTSTATPSSLQTVTESGTYYFRSFNGSCWSTIGSATVTINPAPSNVVSVAGSGTFCNSATLTASYSNPITQDLGTGTLTTNTYPLYSYYKYSRSSSLILRSEMPNEPGVITHLAVYVGTAGSHAFTNISIRLKKTSATTVNTAFPGDGTQVWTGSYTFNSTGWVTFDITDFNWDSDNLLIEWQHGNTAWTSNYPYFAYTAQSSNLQSYSYSDASLPTSGTQTTDRTNYRLTYYDSTPIYWQNTSSNGTSIATPSTSRTVSSSGTYYFRTKNSAGCWGTPGSAAVIINNSSTAPTSITGNTNICAGGSTTLTTSGGTLGTDATNIWYTGSCGTDVYNQPWTNQPFGVSGTTVNSVSGGVLKVTSTNGDPNISMTNIGSFNAITSKYIQIRYKVITGTAGNVEIYYSKNGGSDLSESQVVRVNLTSDAAWHVVNVDMSSSANWTGTITGWRFDWTTASGVTMDIDYICLSNRQIIGEGTSITVSPTANTTYYASRRGACNTTSCANVTVTVIPNNTIAFTSAAGTNNQTKCINTAITNITYSTTTATGATVTGLPAGVSGVWSGNVVTISGTPTVSGTYNYTVTMTGGCTGGTNTASGVITVTAPNSIGFTNGDFVWTGAVSDNWNDPSNWISFDGTAFKTSENIPTISNDVLFTTYGFSCVSYSPVVSLYLGDCHDITIESGSEVIMSSGQVLNVSGNWVNNGTYTAGDGTVRFVGNGQQQIKSGSSSFYNIEFNNTHAGESDISLSDNLTITNSAMFTKGIVKTGTNKVIFGSSASTNSGTSLSFVDGLVEKQSCTGSFIFPTGNVNTRDIGNGTQTYKIWAPLAATPLSASNVSVRYLYSTDGLNEWWYHDWTHQAPLTHTSGREYWLVNSTSNLQVTLNWKNNSPCTIHDFCEEGTGVFYNNDLTIAYWDGIWKDAGGTAGVSSSDGGITSSLYIPFGAKSEKQITFGSKNVKIPLPVELIKFTADCGNNSAEINWQTATEVNNDYFVVEKMKENNEFYEIGRVSGAGNSNSLVSYHFVDHTLSSGYNYYRLTQVDYDGKTRVYDPISLICEKSNSDQPTIEVYPNPFENDINIVIENINEGEFVLELLDDLGRIVYSEDCTSSNSKYQTKLNLSHLRSAVYHLRCTFKENVLNKRVVKR